MYKTINLINNDYDLVNLPAIAGENLKRLPFTLRILLENVVRQSAKEIMLDFEDQVRAIINWDPRSDHRISVPFMPSRLILQDLTGVPLLTDLAAMRSAKARLGADPKTIVPSLPVDLVVDHSLIVDFTNSPDAFARNIALEYDRNHERYQLLRWAQQTFPQFRVVPPGKGIVHQVNLEFLATVISKKVIEGRTVVFPDSVFGTDSHTTMINGLGVLGWGVGGIEAIAAMLGKPSDTLLPDVIGISLEGKLQDGTTPTDLTLRIVELLRQEGVVGQFIEFFGEGLESITVPDRAMIANMTPETGATAIYFPIDNQVLTYLRLTGRDPNHIELVEAVSKHLQLFRDSTTLKPDFSKEIEIDLAEIQPSLAGPFRPHDRVQISDLKKNLDESLHKNKFERGFSIPEEQKHNELEIIINNQPVTLRHGSLLVAAITSCTNTSNPMVMLSAGILARNAVKLGLQINPAVKCSLMPGSQVVTAYLKAANLLTQLENLGFTLVGYGCGTCIGNSGPLHPHIETTLKNHPLVTASISSGNRNFEGRIHPLTRANYLASPPLVVAYALAGTVNIDLAQDPIGNSINGEPVYLHDILPSHQEVETLYKSIQPHLFKSVYENIFTGDKLWEAIYPGEPSELFQWDQDSTYIKEPPYFSDLKVNQENTYSKNIQNARVLVFLGDSVTTDHISPAGTIPQDSPAGNYLRSLGIKKKDFNTYGTRRGNDRVMVRGTFANIRLKNLLVPGKEGGFTRHFPDGYLMTIFEASELYKAEGIPLIVIGGKEYGSGSSRDWAAKGPLLLGVRAIIAESFERIHRTNLIGMGLLPLQFIQGENPETLGIKGDESFSLLGLDTLTVNGCCIVHAIQRDGGSFDFEVDVKIQTESELRSYVSGGILREALFNNKCK